MELTKGRNYFPGKTATDIRVRYYVANSNGSESRITERQAAEIIRVQRETPEFAPMFTVIRDVQEWTANACAWCGSRPRVWEWDCDGKFETSSCDSEQCRAGRNG
ncbi:hypothetical protein ACGFYT_29945 [Streptomyces sp. NPDC048208]|uniref:hypothetical protein n=1 Tax=Streptomyces sp. NPDC048208 TaxID=3365515 RepID=UPI003722494D